MNRETARGARRVLGWLVMLWMLALTVPAQATRTMTSILTNAQGTVVAKMDAAGNVTYTAAYRPYGKQQTGTPQAEPGYTGHVNDPDTGLVYMQARYYDPAAARFLSTDPAGTIPGNTFDFNRYDYANNDPINVVDPTGKVVKLVNMTDKKSVEGWIKSMSAGKFEFDKNGVLHEKSKTSSNDNNRSKYFQNKLEAAIKSKMTITIKVSTTYTDPNTGKEVNLDTKEGGVTIGNKGDNQQVIISTDDLVRPLKDRNGGPLPDGPKYRLAHELVGHAIPRIIGSDTGNAVDDENKVRAQVPGSGRRAREVNHHE